MDWSTIIVGALALAGTLIGAYASNNKNQALIAYRLQQLEDKVNKHNNVIERVYKIEEHEAVLDEKIEHLEGLHQ